MSEPEILQALMKWRTRLSAAAWMVVRDTHAAEDIFQNVALKVMIREVSFESEGALLSWAFITARREGLDWLRRHRREALGRGEDILALLEPEWQAASPQPSGARIDALRECLATAPQSARQLLRLQTPALSAELWGAQCDLQTSAAETLLRINQGSARVKRNVDGTAVELATGHQITVALGGQELLTPTLQPEPVNQWACDLGGLPEVTLGRWLPPHEHAEDARRLRGQVRGGCAPGRAGPGG